MKEVEIFFLRENATISAYLRGEPKGRKYVCNRVELKDEWLILTQDELVPYNWGDDRSRPQLVKTKTTAFPRNEIFMVNIVGEKRPPNIKEEE